MSGFTVSDLLAVLVADGPVTVKLADDSWGLVGRVVDASSGADGLVLTVSIDGDTEPSTPPTGWPASTPTPGKPATQKQVDYVQGLLDRTHGVPDTLAREVSEALRSGLTAADASRFIGALLGDRR